LVGGIENENSVAVGDKNKNAVGITNSHPSDMPEEKLSRL